VVKGSDDGGSGSDEDEEDDDSLWGSDDEDKELEIDVSGVDPSLLSLLGGEPSEHHKRVATTWVAPEFAGLDNSAEGLDYAKRVREEQASRSVGVVIAGVPGGRRGAADSEDGASDDDSS
jgi:hypothetical protein